MNWLWVSLLSAAALMAGNRQVALKGLFVSSGDDPDTLRLVGFHDWCHHVGGDTRDVRIEVKGNVDAEFGRETGCGGVGVSRHAGAAAGMDIVGGSSQIDGSAGDGIADLTPSATRGMNGGGLVVADRVGAGCGERIRRGFSVLAGDAGE